MNIEFLKGAVLQSILILAKSEKSETVNINRFLAKTIETKRALRKTITALSQDGFIIPQSTFGSTYTLNMERISQIKF